MIFKFVIACGYYHWQFHDDIERCRRISSIEYVFHAEDVDFFMPHSYFLQKIPTIFLLHTLLRHFRLKNAREGVYMRMHPRGSWEPARSSVRLILDGRAHSTRFNYHLSTQTLHQAVQRPVHQPWLVSVWSQSPTSCTRSPKCALMVWRFHMWATVYVERHRAQDQASWNQVHCIRLQIVINKTTNPDISAI